MVSISFSLFWPILVLIGFAFVAYLLANRAMKLLTTEEKGRLVEATASAGKWRLLLFAVVLLFVAFPGALAGVDKTLLVIGLCVAMCLPIVLGLMYVMKKMRELELPETFRRKYLLARMVNLAGFVVFLIMVSLRF